MNKAADSLPHRRYNPLTGEWVVVSAHRLLRPWLGEQVPAKNNAIPEYSRECYLCPGNRRAGDRVNPKYQSVYLFVNDFPAIVPHRRERTGNNESASELLRQEDVAGVCKVLCYSPRHDLTLARMSLPAIQTIINTWAEQVAELGEKYRYVQIFENRGDMVGCSNPHPHGQIWACDYIPSEIAREHLQQDRYFKKHGSDLLGDYLASEEAAKRRGDNRFVLSNAHWTVVVPYWAYWPFETLVLPKRNIGSLVQTDAAERAALAEVLKTLCTKYDRLFDTNFPYVMGWHGEVSGTPPATGHRRLHAHFYPPLLRSAEVRKHRAGFEMLAEAQRDLTPELAAERIRGH